MCCTQELISVISGRRLVERWSQIKFHREHDLWIASWKGCRSFFFFLSLLVFSTSPPVFGEKTEKDVSNRDICLSRRVRLDHRKECVWACDIWCAKKRVHGSVLGYHPAVFLTSSSFEIYLFTLCAEVSCLHVWLYTMCVKCSWRPEGGRSPGTGVVGDWEPTM